MEDRYLFKAKFDDSDRWVKGQLVEVNDTYLIIPNHASKILAGWFSTSNIIEVKKDTICQCTGLKDKNGKLIWENDVVKQFADCNELGNSLYFFYQIRWNNEYSAFEGYEIYTEETVLFPDLEDIEVIGNIFDNPELLESEG